MSFGSMKLYHILVDKGIDRDLAQEALSEFLTREEAQTALATKDDIAKVIMWVAGLLVGQTATIVAIIALFFV